MSTLEKVQEWYRSKCDGDWEHSYGVKIDTLDNPGWSVTIDLDDTGLEEKKFEPVGIGVGKESVEGSEQWLTCYVEKKKFVGRGGPHKLEEILEIFLRWTESPTSRYSQRADRSRDFEHAASAPPHLVIRRKTARPHAPRGSSVTLGKENARCHP